MKLITLAAAALTLSSFGPQEAAQPAGPAAQQEAFLAGLKAGDVEKAYETLFKGTRFAGESAKMIGETEKGMNIYGEAADLENLGLIRQDKHQALGIGVLCCDQAPLNFYFTWYRKTEASPWKLTGFSFNDQAREYWEVRK